jgi:hypothetical protein
MALTARDRSSIPKDNAVGMDLPAAGETTDGA